MQQDNNHIENNLRQLENQQLPDLSEMETHWNDMQTALLSAIPVNRNHSGFKKYLKKILIATGIAAAVTAGYFIKKFPVNNNNAVQLPVTDTTVKQQPVFTDTIIKKGMAIRLTAKKVVVPSAAMRIQPAVLTIRTDSLSITKKADSVLPEISFVAAASTSLKGFYTAMQKPAQEFVLDAAKGGIFVCTEGTTLSFPAAAFVDPAGNIAFGQVTVKVTEYYKYADMIAANLTTTSDGRQLVTGGMIKLTAALNGSELQLREDKVVNLSMPAKNYDAEMKLFTADENRKNNIGGLVKLSGDTAAIVNYYSNTLNWQPANNVRQLAFDGKTNFLNLEDEPVRVRETKTKRIALFHVTNELPMTEDEIKAALKEKYGTYYDVIKVKKVKPTVNLLFTRAFAERKHIGDSIRLTVEQAVKWHYIDRNDSMRYVQKVKTDSLQFVSRQIFSINPGWDVTIKPGNLGSVSSVSLAKMTDSLKMVYAEKLRVAQAYNFTVNKMGWINCDRFYNYTDKSDFVITLPQDVQAEKFVTQLVFTSIRSVMPGQPYQNKIGFLNIPVNMPVYLIGLGERNGKVVSFMQQLKTGASISVSSLEETTPEAFKEKVKQLDL